MTDNFSHSAIYLGDVLHRRFSPKKHHFNYSLYMLALDVDDVEGARHNHGIFGFSWYHPLRFVEKDYLRGEPFSLSTRIKNKVAQLQGHQDIEKILMLVQVRTFGLYFSPANFYFCYNKSGECTQMLAEVSNTPWNERHYYLVDLLKEKSDLITKKSFQVSPFMNLDMSYVWQIKPPSDHNKTLVIKIKNKRFNEARDTAETLFDASLVLKKQRFSQKNLMKTWLQLPLMSLKIVMAIYWQALKLFIKKVPFIGYQQPTNNKTGE